MRQQCLGASLSYAAGQALAPQSPNFDGKRPIGGFDYIRRRLPGSGWTLHGLRRTMRSGLSALRVRAEVAEATIGHAPRGLLRVYDRHDYLQEKTEALTLWADRLRRIVG
jgi:hypothetical protein